MTRGRAKRLAVVGAVLTGLIGAAYVTEIWIAAQWTWKGSGSEGGIGSRLGELYLAWFDQPIYVFHTGFHWLPRDSSMWFWWPSITVDREVGMYVVRIPLWIPLCAIGLPTIYLARVARRATRGGCSSCGYDLSGTAGAVCPECGKERAA